MLNKDYGLRVNVKVEGGGYRITDPGCKVSLVARVSIGTSITLSCFSIGTDN